MQRVQYSQLRKNVQKLPRLPIPSLDDTLQRYKASVEPLKKPAFVEAHLGKMEKFRKESASNLQKILIAEDKAAAKTEEYPHSYIEPIWDKMYCGFRGASPINMSPGITMKAVGKNLTQAEVASRMMSSIYRYVVKLRSTEGIEVNSERPVDVSQLASQFGFSRVPRKEVDGFSCADIHSLKTFTILRDGNIFILRIADENGNLYPQSTLEAGLEHIMKITPADNTAPVSVLTSWNRNDWFAARSKLESKPGNQELLQQIDDSIAVLCLDHVYWNGDIKKKNHAVLHGGVEEHENRWYDKHQIIVSADGQVAFNFEHSFSDGMCWSSWASEVYCDVTGAANGGGCKQLPTVAEASPLDKKEVKALVTPVTLEFGKSTAGKIREAREAIKADAANVNLIPMELEVGKTQLKKLGLSPDAFMQIAFHLAYFNMHNHVAPTYESCSTAGFFHGRTETIRTGSRAMGEFLHDAEKGTLSKHLALAAAKHHVSLAKEAQIGQGVDRHLLALNKLAERENDKVALDFFNDKLYKYSNTWLLSTSNVSMPFIEYFNFGPVAENGYGIGYNIDNKETRLVISNFENSEATDAKKLSLELHKAVANLQKLLSGVEEVETPNSNDEE